MHGPVNRDPPSGRRAQPQHITERASAAAIMLAGLGEAAAQRACARITSEGLEACQHTDEFFHRQVTMALASAADKGNPGPQRGRRNQ